MQQRSLTPRKREKTFTLGQEPHLRTLLARSTCLTSLREPSLQCSVQIWIQVYDAI
jgi:hypothetical protein